jgi:hypothetical protein
MSAVVAAWIVSSKGHVPDMTRLLLELRRDEGTEPHALLAELRRLCHPVVSNEVLPPE